MIIDLGLQAPGCVCAFAAKIRAESGRVEVMWTQVAGFKDRLVYPVNIRFMKETMWR